ncbi:SARP family transcriptional regulator [Actinoplanes sp. NBRC 14428]|nr:SARP family transcriptional regulator [Actinoplanes sp. NBRC 14428]
MDFRLLGPFEVCDEGRPVEVSRRRRERCLLGLLLLEPGRVVGIDRLVGLLWDGPPPVNARSTLSSHVSRLRGRLDPDRSGRHGLRIVNRGDAYLVEVAPERIDAHRFRSLVERARTIGDASARARTLREALALWRGPLLADVASDRLRDRVGAGLAELRLTAVEACVDAELSAGRHAVAAAEFADIVAANPGRQRLLSRHLLALYRAGRQLDALAAYRAARTQLAEQFGLDPEPELQRLHTAILRRDPALDPPAERVVAGPAPAPAQLPLPPRGFTGRTAELAALTALLDDRAGTPAVIISAIAGTGGVGKTALALHWGAAIRDRFPGGQLYLNLRGYSAMPPLTAEEALGQLLRGLGVPVERVPADPEEAAATYRSLLAGRRTLILLDNAADVAQVRPLLPGGPPSLALVTSRNRMAGLAAIEGVHRVILGPFSPAEATGYVRRALGTERADTESAAVATLVRVCDHLPLALRIAVANLGDDPDQTVERYLRDLDRDRLAALRVDGDPHTAVLAVLAVSYGRLTAPARRLFRLLSLHPGTDFGSAAAAAVAGLASGEAARLVATLVDDHLVEEHTPGRYTMHDLIRLYARDRADADETPGDRARASRRIVDWYLAVVAAMCRVAAPHRYRPRPEAVPPEPGAGVEPPFAADSATGALEFLDGERPNLVAVVRLAGRLGDDEATVDLAAMLGAYYQRCGDAPDSLAVYEEGLAAARRLGDRSALATFHNSLGIGNAVLLRYADAAVHLRHAYRLSEETGDRKAQSRTLLNLGRLHLEQARYDEALDAFERSLAAREAGRGYPLNNIGYTLFRRGDPDRALEVLEQALAAHRADGDRGGEGTALDSMGAVHLERGDTVAALRYFEAARAALREAADPEAEAGTLVNLGEVRLRRGEHDEAVACLRLAVERFAVIPDRREASTRARLAGAHLTAGDTATARTELLTALEALVRLPDPATEATVHRMLGDLERREGRPESAREHLRRAVDGYLRAGLTAEARQLDQAPASPLP